MLYDSRPDLDSRPVFPALALALASDGHDSVLDSDSEAVTRNDSAEARPRPAGLSFTFLLGFQNKRKQWYHLLNVV